jgi:hypothetical protein
VLAGALDDVLDCDWEALLPQPASSPKPNKTDATIGTSRVLRVTAKER